MRDVKIDRTIRYDETNTQLYLPKEQVNLNTLFIDIAGENVASDLIVEKEFK